MGTTILLPKFEVSGLRALRPIYGRNNHASRLTIERLVGKFESTGTVQKFPVPVRQRSARSVIVVAWRTCAYNRTALGRAI